LTGEDIGGIFIHELFNSYLPKRTDGTFAEVWVYLVINDSMTLRDLEHIMSVCFTHRIPCKIFESHEALIKNAIDEVQQWHQPINLNYPPYINRSGDLIYLWKELRGYPEMTEERMQELEQMYSWYCLYTLKCPEGSIPTISFHNFDDLFTRWYKEIEKRDAFWFKFCEHWFEGNNPLPITKREKTPELKALMKCWRQ